MWPTRHPPAHPRSPLLSLTAAQVRGVLLRRSQGALLSCTLAVNEAHACIQRASRGAVDPSAFSRDACLCLRRPGDLRACFPDVRLRASSSAEVAGADRHPVRWPGAPHSRRCSVRPRSRGCRPLRTSAVAPDVRAASPWPPRPASDGQRRFRVVGLVQRDVESAGEPNATELRMNALLVRRSVRWGRGRPPLTAARLLAGEEPATPHRTPDDRDGERGGAAVPRKRLRLVAGAGGARGADGGRGCGGLHPAAAGAAAQCGPLRRGHGGAERLAAAGQPVAVPCARGRPPLAPLRRTRPDSPGSAGVGAGGERHPTRGPVPRRSSRSERGPGAVAGGPADCGPAPFRGGAEAGRAAWLRGAQGSVLRRRRVHRHLCGRRAESRGDGEQLCSVSAGAAAHCTRGTPPRAAAAAALCAEAVQAEWVDRHSNFPGAQADLPGWYYGHAQVCLAGLAMQFYGVALHRAGGRSPPPQQRRYAHRSVGCRARPNAAGAADASLRRRTPGALRPPGWRRGPSQGAS